MTVDRTEFENAPEWALMYNPEHLKLVLSVFKDNVDTAYTPEEITDIISQEDNYTDEWNTPYLMIDLKYDDLLKKQGGYYIADGELRHNPEEVIDHIPDN